MSSRAWFEDIRSRVLVVKQMEDDVEDLRIKAGPRGQSLEPQAHSSGVHDASGPIIRVVEAEAMLDTYKASTNDLVTKALVILYGTDGNGGLAKAKSSATAECVCGYYLMGKTWQEVADDLASPGKKGSADWCRMRASRAFAFIDRWGPATVSHI